MFSVKRSTQERVAYRVRTALLMAGVAFGTLNFALVGCGGGGGNGSGPSPTPRPTATPTPTPTPTPVPLVGITVAPDGATVAVSATLQMTATVTNASNTSVTWRVEGGAGKGTINADGLYTAPGVAGDYSVTAVSNADPTRSSTAIVRVRGGGASVILE